MYITDTIFDWIGLAYGLVYPINVACGRAGWRKIGKPMKNMIRVALKRGIRWPDGNLTEIAWEAWKLWGWGIILPIFEMDQNWIWLDPGKKVHILENNFSIFLLSGNSNESVYKVCNVLRLIHFLTMKTSNIWRITSYWI